jgi:hypothetical protein
VYLKNISKWAIIQEWVLNVLARERVHVKHLQDI